MLTSNKSLLNGGLNALLINHLFAFHKSNLLKKKKQNNIVLGRQYHDAYSTDESSEAERGKATVLG